MTASEDPDLRPRRIAENESRFRDVNDRLGRDLQAFVGDDERVEFVCECGDLACRERVALLVSEYERVRADSRRFAVLPGHEIPDVEDVFERGEGFLIVEKALAVAEQVRRSDPRTAG